MKKVINVGRIPAKMWLDEMEQSCLEQVGEDARESTRRARAELRRRMQELERVRYHHDIRPHIDYRKANGAKKTHSKDLNK